MSENTTEEHQPTEAELKAYRENMTKFYKEQIPYLKQQKEYECLLADVEEARAKRYTMTLRLIQMTTPPQGPPEARPEAPQENAPDAPKKERKLKPEA